MGAHTKYTAVTFRCSMSVKHFCEALNGVTLFHHKESKAASLEKQHCSKLLCGGQPSAGVFHATPLSIDS